MNRALSLISGISFTIDGPITKKTIKWKENQTDIAVKTFLGLNIIITPYDIWNYFFFVLYIEVFIKCEFLPN